MTAQVLRTSTGRNAIEVTKVNYATQDLNDGEFIFLEGSFHLIGERHCVSATISLPAPSPTIPVAPVKGDRSERREKMSLLRRQTAERMIQAQENAAILQIKALRITRKCNISLEFSTITETYRSEDHISLHH